MGLLFLFLGVKLIHQRKRQCLHRKTRGCQRGWLFRRAEPGADSADQDRRWRLGKVGVVWPEKHPDQLQACHRLRSDIRWKPVLSQPGGIHEHTSGWIPDLSIQHSKTQWKDRAAQRSTCKTYRQLWVTGCNPLSWSRAGRSGGHTWGTQTPDPTHRSASRGIGAVIKQ